MRFRLVFAGILLTAALPAISQVAPSATQGGLPLIVGGGFSRFYTDWAGNLSGPTIWIDWNLTQFHHLNGLGVEIEGRDLNYIRYSDDPKLRQDVGGGGPIYRWHHFSRFDPYGRLFFGLGSIDFSNPYTPTYTHDTRFVLAPAGGGEYRLWGGIGIRADYEYQVWHDFKNHHALNPQGGTIGMTYDFSRMHSR